MPQKKNIRRQTGTRPGPQKDKSLREARGKTAEEPRMIGLRALAAGSSTVGCWFKDAGGGPDFCVPMPSADACTNAGGSPTAGGCPNTLAFLASHIADLKDQLADIRKPRPSTAKKRARRK